MKPSSSTLLILCVLFWSGNYVLGRVVVATIPPITLTYLRWLGAFLIFLAFTWKEFKEHLPVLKEKFWLFVLLGIAGMMGYNIFQYLSVKYTTAINASIINSSTPMLTAVAAYIFLHEKLNLRKVGGILLAFFGVLTIITDSHWLRIFTNPVNMGDAMMLIAISLNTVYYIVLRKKGKTVPPYTLFLYTALGALAVCWPLPLLENYVGGLSWVGELRYYHVLSYLYFAIFPSILSMLFFNKAILDMGPVKTSIYSNLGIVFTSILGIVFLHEKLLVSHLLGGLFIVCGVYLTNRNGRTDKLGIPAQKE